MPGPPPSRSGVREALRVRGFRGLLTASGLSVLGDQVTRIAVALLVYERSGSALASSATYACSYLTWIVGGPLLSALADRHRRRRLMVAVDLLRAALVAVLLVPGLPLPAVFAVLVAVGLLAPPFDAAKGALLPEVVTGDRYVAASAVQNTVLQGAQVAGFLLGGLLVSAAGTRGAFAVDAATFLVSAAVLRTLVPEGGRPDGAARTTLVADVREGVGVVLADPLLRLMLGYGLALAAGGIVPEGLAVAAAAEVGGGSALTGVLTAAAPAGFLVGSFAVLRVAPERRRALLPALLLLSAVPLVLSPLAQTGTVIALLWALAGVGGAGQLVANATYMVAVSPATRGRAFGVAATGLMAVQGLVLLVLGRLADLTGGRTATMVAGVGVLALAPLLWRSGRRSGQLAPLAGDTLPAAAAS